MGGVGMAGNGTLHAVWSRSSATAGDFPSSYAAYQLPTDTPNTISPKELLKAGTGVYTGERWGDYVGVAQDPLVPSAVWQANHTRAGAEWKTWVSRLQTARHDVRPDHAGPRPRYRAAGSGRPASSAPTWPGPGRSTGVGGIPANAVAVTGNVTVTQQRGGGFVAVTPTATNNPPSSTINFPVGDVRANNVTVALSSAGTLSAVYKARDRQEDPPHLRRDRLLPGRRHGRDVHPAHPGPRARHARRPDRPAPASSSPTRPDARRRRRQRRAR